jgi:hypothetical protein
MSDQESLDALRERLNVSVMRMRLMSTEQLLEACMEIVEPIAPGTKDLLLADALVLRAGEGSIEAAAALFAMNAPEEKCLDALKALLRRNPAVGEAYQVELLTRMFTEFADEEVAAGRMTVTVGPKGERLYGSATRPRRRGRRRGS